MSDPDTLPVEPKGNPPFDLGREFGLRASSGPGLLADALKGDVAHSGAPAPSSDPEED